MAKAVIKAKKVANPVSEKAKMAAENKRWQAQSDLRTLQDAKLIQSDQRRLSAAAAEAKSQIAAIQSVVKK